MVATAVVVVMMTDQDMIANMWTIFRRFVIHLVFDMHRRYDASNLVFELAKARRDILGIPDLDLDPFWQYSGPIDIAYSIESIIRLDGDLWCFDAVIFVSVFVDIFEFFH